MGIVDRLIQVARQGGPVGDLAGIVQDMNCRIDELRLARDKAPADVDNGMIESADALVEAIRVVRPGGPMSDLETAIQCWYGLLDAARRATPDGFPEEIERMLQAMEKWLDGIRVEFRMADRPLEGAGPVAKFAVSDDVVDETAPTDESEKPAETPAADRQPDDPTSPIPEAGA
ncbi:hypothetical protein ES707_13390 [subsurface metagenome]